MRRAGLQVLVVLGVLATGAAPAAAATITVTTTGDEIVKDGKCSLREAILAVDSPGSANGDCAAAAFGANTIVLGPHTYTLSLSSSGELMVAATVSNLTIAGLGETRTVISATFLGDRVLEIASGATVTITNLTITGGHAKAGKDGPDGTGTENGGNGIAGENGGAILNDGTLTVNGAALSGNQAGDGGSGGRGGSPSSGNGHKGGNGGAGGDGGAIYNTGTLSLVSATIAHNTAGDGGTGGTGGSGDAGGNAGDGGRGGVAGGIIGGKLTVTGSTLNGNDAGGGGTGGTGGSGTTTTGGDGGGGGNGGAAGGMTDTGTLSVVNSTFASNSAGDGGTGGSGGGGITFGGAGGDGGNGARGGALSTNATVGATLNSATIAGNTAGSGGAGGSGVGLSGHGTPGTDGTGGGISNSLTATTVRNSLLASNSGGNCAGTIVDAGHNLSFGGTGCPVTFASGNPVLGPLQFNGGPTETISLGHGSAAIDKVPATGAGCPGTDQRGVRRPSGPACDIGAYEVAPPKATTGAATAITLTSATLTGSVTPNAGSATVQFEYGTTAKYGAKSAAVTTSGVTPVAALAKVKRLKPGTTYHYLVLVTTMDGTAKGRDRTFRTLPAPAISRLTIKPGKFKARKGATVSYTDSQPSTVTFVVQRCTKTKHGRCTKYVKASSFTHHSKAGRNSFHFTPRRQKSGRYRLQATPRFEGVTGKTASVTFRID